MDAAAEGGGRADARAGGGGDRPGPERATRDAGVRLGRRLRRAAGVPDGQADAPRRGGRVRPHGRRRAPRGRSVPVDQQRLSLRRRAGQAVRRESEPEVGRAARHEPAPLRHRARPRPARRVPVARGEPPPLRLHLPIRVGALALRLRRQPARPRASRALRPGLVGAAGGRPRPCEARAAVVRAAALPRSDRQGGAALERPDERARRAAVRGVRLQPVRAQPGGGRGHRAVHARDGGCLRAGEPVRPGRGDRRSGAPDERSYSRSSAARLRWRWRATTRAPGRYSATAASRRSPRPART